MTGESTETSEQGDGLHLQATKLSQAVFWSFSITQGSPEKTGSMGEFFAISGLGVGLEDEVLNIARQNLIEMTAKRLDFDLKPGWKEKIRNSSVKMGFGGVAAKLATPEEPVNHLSMWQIVNDAATSSGRARLSEREAFFRTMEKDWDDWIAGYAGGLAKEGDSAKEVELRKVVMSLGDWLLDKDYQYLIDSKNGRPGKSAYSLGDYSDVRDQADPWLSYIARYALEEQDLPGPAGQLTQKLRELKYVETRLADAKRPGRGSAFYERADGEAYIEKLYLVVNKYRQQHRTRFDAFLDSDSPETKTTVAVRDAFGEIYGKYYKRDKEGWYHKD